MTRAEERRLLEVADSVNPNVLPERTVKLIHDLAAALRARDGFEPSKRACLLQTNPSFMSDVQTLSTALRYGTGLAGVRAALATAEEFVEARHQEDRARERERYPSWFMMEADSKSFAARIDAQARGILEGYEEAERVAARGRACLSPEQRAKVDAFFANREDL